MQAVFRTLRPQIARPAAGWVPAARRAGSQPTLP
jgi:hypothetical protein